MNLTFTHTELFLQPSPLHKLPALPSRHHHRTWKRRRLKRLTLHCHFNLTPAPFQNLIHTLITQFPSINSINYIAPTIGFASGLALFLSSNSSPKSVPNPNPIGEWILFTSPTPFNRFVTLRCPSIYFPGNELLENVNEKLVKEDRHYVKVNSGRMIGKSGGDEINDAMVLYQRICVSTDDGGVLSIDWPANLDLEEERGLDTTVLIVPGTAEGSNERKIKVFVCECLRRGVFPIVMNPRGSAGSPLTTARLFTAADSDDISTAVQFINKKRPWTTLMGVGWGYGANMLTKYLAEFGERTRLTAATCIDNPFDLEEAARSSVYNMDFDQRHTKGLINILESNKELFQGRGKGFDVEGALSASSTREFEEAISMVSYGFDTVEEFYANSSTRDVVGRVKIPVLFIQNDDGTVPLFSIPRSSISENPYTSLLLCSYSTSSKIMDGRLTISWCQHLTIEWLTAVELGLLKGRHPLLKDVDLTVNPSKGLSLVENRTSNKTGNVERLLNFNNAHSTRSPLKLQANDTVTSIQFRSTKDVGGLPVITKASQLEDNNVSLPSSATNDAVEAERVDPSDNERGHVLQTAQMVVNMLDVTMPDTLSDEQKKKVLNAVGQGETLIKALQDAVPEDVRGKLTSAVSGILQSQQSNIKFDKLLSLGHIPDVASGLNTKKLEKIVAPIENADDNVQSSDQKKIANDPENGSYKVDSGSDKPPEYVESEKQSSEISQKPNDTGTFQSTGNHGNNSHDSEKVNQNEMGDSLENEQLSVGNNSQTSDRENVSEINANQESVVDQNKVESESVGGPSDQTEETNNHPNDFSTEQNNGSEANDTGDKSSASSPALETEMVENEAESSDKKEELDPKSIPSPNSEAPPPSFSVSQAFNALTGFDDSTQVAVNSVFNVIEEMIDHLEEEKDNEDNLNEGNKTDKVKKLSECSMSNNHLIKKDQRVENLMSKESSNDNNSSCSDTNDTQREFKTENETSVVPSTREFSAGNLAEHPNSSSEKIPCYLTTFPYGDPLYKERLKTYLYSKMRNEDPLNVDTASALYLNYIPQEGKWKLLDEAEDDIAPVDKYSTREGGYREDQTDTVPRFMNTDNIIEPPYVILDSSKPDGQNEELKEINVVNDSIEVGCAQLKDSTLFIKNLILDCLNVEVGRRVRAADMEELELQLSRDIEHVADAVSMEAAHGDLHVGDERDDLPEKLGTIDGTNILEVISSAVEDTKFLKKVVPVGVIVGASLAALREFFNVAALDGNDGKELTLDPDGNCVENLIPAIDKERTERHLEETENQDYYGSSVGENEDNSDLENTRNNNVMVGAVTAALGASAFLVHQQNTETHGTLNEPLEKEDSKENTIDKPQNIVTSLAEKAMSVASPVVPTKDGEVDHDRLVAMLAELGQRGGILRLVGKLALLWGGIRGAISLTDKLISFLHIAERPLFQRILGFVSLVLLLWSPVIIPLLPTIIGSWGTRPFKIVEFACIAGFYVSVMIMVTLWGKRIHNYDDPLLQYGLDFVSFPKFQNFLKGLVGGGVLVLLIYSINSLLGCAHLYWPATLSSSTSEPVALVKSYGRMLMLIFQGIATATGVSVVEELLFRSWLPREIATDFGYHRGIIISGLVFAICQRSTWEIPGLWLLSLSLSGAQHMSHGSLSLPIGLRTGMLASNFILKTGGFLTYQPNFHLSIIGGHPFQPYSGVVGIAFSLLLAIILYPRRPIRQRKTTRVIRD